MPRTALTDDVCTIEAPPVRLEFRWSGDRWAHTLQVGGDVVAASEEWDVSAGDPARVVSPAYQQLSHQSSPEGEQALLVGQWGPHHFSGVFTVRESSQGVTVEADVAVRTRAELAALAGTYRVALDSSALAEADPSGVVWNLDAPPGRLRFEPVGSGRMGLGEAGRRAARVQAEAEVVAGDRTQRLVYRWLWSAAPRT